MKTLFFALSMLWACGPSKVEIKEDSTDEVQFGADDHTGSHGTIEEEISADSLGLQEYINSL